jgi:phage terminase large subunit-like protein
MIPPKRDVSALREITERKLAAKMMLAARRRNDPLYTFEPTDKQRPFIDAVLEGKHDETWFIAANRAGKSDAGAFCGSKLAREGDRSERVKWVGAKGSNVSIRDRSTSGWVSALDFPTSRDVIQPKYFDNGFVPPGAAHEPFIPEYEINEWRVSDQILKMKNGSIIGFKSAEQGRKKYQGADKDWVHNDEEHPEDIYNEERIRVGARPLRIFNTCTLLPPEGQVGGVTWVYGKIIKPWQDGKLENVGVYNSSIYDNPHIPPEEIRKLEAKYPVGSIERRIRLNGEMLPGLSGSRAYENFDRRLHVKHQPDINLRRPLCWMLDFNVEPFISHIGQFEILPGNRKLFRIHRQLMMEDSGNIQEMCDLFYMVHPRHNAEVWIYGDATARHRSVNAVAAQSSYQMILNSMRSYSAPFRLKVPEDNPSVPDRINAVNVALRNEYGIIGVEMDPSCEELIADMEQVLRSPVGGIKKTSNRKDPYYRRTHASDGAGYWICFEQPVRAIYEETTHHILLPIPRYGQSHRQ